MEKDQQDEVRKRRHLTPEEKYQIFIEATLAKARDNGGISEVLRRWGIHSSDLNRIRQTVEQGAIGAFRARKSRKPTVGFRTGR